MLKRIRAKAVLLSGNPKIVKQRIRSLARWLVCYGSRTCCPSQSLSGFAGMVRGAGLTVGWGLAADRSPMSLVLIACAERPEVSGVSIEPYGSVIGRLLRNLVQVHRSLVIPPKRICDIPEDESS